MDIIQDGESTVFSKLKVVFNEGPITTGTGGNNSFTIQENGIYFITRHVYCGTNRERATAYVNVNNTSIASLCAVMNSTSVSATIVQLNVGDIVSFTQESGIGHSTRQYDSAAIVKIGD